MRAPLPAARANLELVRTSDGSVIALGGIAASGNPVGDVFAYDTDNDFWQVQDDVRMPGIAMGATALVGGRVAIWASSVPGRSSAVVRILQRAPEWISTLPTLRYHDVEFDAPALDDVRVSAADGLLLMTGVDTAGEAQALLLDPGRGSVTTLDAGRAPSALVTMADGVAFGVDARGAELRRVSTLVPLSQPPASFVADDFALDAPEHWQARGAQLTALQDEVRADVAPYTFDDFDLSVRSSGEVALLLTREARPPIRVGLGPSEAGPALCTLAATGELTIERRGSTLTLRNENEERRCTIEGLTDRLGIAFTANEGATLTNLRTTRI